MSDRSAIDRILTEADRCVHLAEHCKSTPDAVSLLERAARLYAGAGYNDAAAVAERAARARQKGA